MKIAFICSGNGGAIRAFLESANILSRDVLIYTDRACGIEGFAANNDIPTKRFEFKDNAQFSLKVCEDIDGQGGVVAVLLFYTRMVTSDLFTKYVVLNFHPSLLPAYKGFGAIKNAVKDQVKFIGTTMHLVNDQADSGQIIAQCVYGIDKQMTIDYLNQISFIHKVYLLFLVKEAIESKVGIYGLLSEQEKHWKCGVSCNPFMKSETYREVINSIIEKQNLDIELV